MLFASQFALRPLSLARSPFASLDRSSLTSLAPAFRIVVSYLDCDAFRHLSFSTAPHTTQHGPSPHLHLSYHRPRQRPSGAVRLRDQSHRSRSSSPHPTPVALPKRYLLFFSWILTQLGRAELVHHPTKGGAFDPPLPPHPTRLTGLVPPSLTALPLDSVRRAIRPSTVSCPRSLVSTMVRRAPQQRSSRTRELTRSVLRSQRRCLQRLQRPVHLSRRVRRRRLRQTLCVILCA